MEMQNRWHSHFLDRTLYYVCRAVSRQMENPSSKEVCVPDTPLQASCRVRHFPDEFQGGWSGKQVPYRHGGFRPGQRSCGEPEFALKEQVFSHLDRLAAKAHLSEGDRIAYDKAVDRYNVSRIVENNIREQAVAEGRLKGRLEIARKLKENGFSIADIVRIAGLSPEEIDKL